MHYTTRYGRPYNSDEVAQQNILWDWQHGYHAHAAVGDDNWFIKYPLYVLVNNLPLAPISQVLLTSWLLLMTTAVLLLGSLQAILDTLRRTKAQPGPLAEWALPIATLFLAALPKDAFWVLRMPNSRNVELGIILVFFVLLLKMVKNQASLSRHRVAMLVVSSVMMGALLANDPLFLYLAFVPLALTTTAHFTLTKKICLKSRLSQLCYQQLVVFIGLALVAYKLVVHLLLTILPLSFLVHKSTLATPRHVVRNGYYLLTGGIRIFGLELPGRSLPVHVPTSICFGLVGLVAIGGLVSFIRKTHWSLPAVLLVVVSATSAAASLASDIVQPDSVSRYLILLMLLELLGLFFAVYWLKSKRQLIYLGLVLATLLGSTLASNLGQLWGNRKNPPAAYETSIVEALKQRDLSKGFANYWKAGIVTFLSGHTIHVFPAECDHHLDLVRYYDVLVESAPMTQLHPNQSFYIFNPLARDECSAADLSADLGAPSEIIDVNNQHDTLIAVYNYDITTRVGR